MNPDEIAIRPVVYSNTVRPVHRESPSRDSAGGQRAATQEPAESEAPEMVEEAEPAIGEETRLIDLQA